MSCNITPSLLERVGLKQGHLRFCAKDWIFAAQYKTKLWEKAKKKNPHLFQNLGTVPTVEIADPEAKLTEQAGKIKAPRQVRQNQLYLFGAIVVGLLVYFYFNRDESAGAGDAAVQAPS
jgi:hypothetical protein